MKTPKHYDKPLTAVFLGKNGHDFELAKALEKLVAGERYEITGASIGQSSSTVRVNGASYNSVMFDIDVATLIERFPEHATQLHGRFAFTPPNSGKQ